MYHIAYEKETRKILGFIETDDEIDFNEVFSNFENYDVVHTMETPPLTGYTNYKVSEDNESFVKIEMPLSESENIILEINQLKQQLSDTDYQAIKYAEGQLTEMEYEPIREQRQVWRDRINELEEMLRDL